MNDARIIQKQGRAKVDKEVLSERTLLRKGCDWGYIFSMKGKGASVSVVMAWDVIYGLGRHYLFFAFAFDDTSYIHGTLDSKIGVLVTEKPRLRTLYYCLLRLSSLTMQPRCV